jgi:hypothetical protein
MVCHAADGGMVCILRAKPTDEWVITMHTAEGWMWVCLKHTQREVIRTGGMHVVMDRQNSQKAKKASRGANGPHIS